MGFFERLLSGHHGSRHHKDSGYHDSDYGHRRRPYEAPREASVACASCRALNPMNARFCQQCGGAVTRAASCAQCGTALPPGAKFCGQCGNASR